MSSLCPWWTWGRIHRRKADRSHDPKFRPRRHFYRDCHLVRIKSLRWTNLPLTGLQSICFDPMTYIVHVRMAEHKTSPPDNLRSRSNLQSEYFEARAVLVFQGERLYVQLIRIKPRTSLEARVVLVFQGERLYVQPIRIKPRTSWKQLT
jgi:hypothetical protein